MKECFFTVLEFYQKNRWKDLQMLLFLLLNWMFPVSRKWIQFSYPVNRWFEKRLLFGCILFGFCFKAKTTVKMYVLFLLCLFGFSFKEKLTLKKCSYFLRFFHRDSLLSVKERMHWTLSIWNIVLCLTFDIAILSKTTAGLTSDKATQEFSGEK